jgi:hypothetical protein
MIEYIPEIKDIPNVVNVISAWGQIPTIIKDIILRFKIKTDHALEFGVEEGYSTTALAYYFKNVIGVDTFRNDCWENSLERPSQYTRIKELLKDYPNIMLVESMFEDYIKTDLNWYDLIHIDILHDYRPTFDCGDWALRHSNCVIFHDTMSFPSVMQAVTDLAKKYSFEFYNYPEDYGLGILVKQ